MGSKTTIKENITSQEAKIGEFILYVSAYVNKL